MKKGFYAVIVLLFIFSAAVPAQSSSPLIISEVMFYPSDSNGEFIEIYNTSATDIIDLAGYKIKYYTSAANSLTGLINGTQIAPGSFAVILQGSYDFNNGVYKSIIPAAAVVLKLSSGSFGSSGMSNTTGREVSLINPENQVVDSYTYTADNSAGISDEKVNLSKDNSAANWKNSTVKNGTPGSRNSVTPFNYDLKISFGSLIPPVPVIDDTLRISTVIKNTGLQSASSFSVSLFNDLSNDSTGQPGELIAVHNFSELAGGDSVIAHDKLYLQSAGTYKILAELIYDKDENASNNRAIRKVTVIEKLASFNEVVLNEIMYAPANGEPEWIELYNNSSRAFNLNGWKLGNNSTFAAISSKDIMIKPDEYVVVSDDSSITKFHKQIPALIVKSLPALKNAGDEIRLRNNINGPVDSVRYQPSWGGTGGRSLERVSPGAPSSNPDNWKSCTSSNKSTPGFLNSVSPKKFDVGIVSFTSVLNYAEIGGEAVAVIRIENSGSESASNYSIKLYRDINLNSIPDSGELLNELAGPTLVPGQSIEYSFILPGIIAGKNQFIALIDFPPDQYTDNNISIMAVDGIKLNERRGDIVINEVMYDPNYPEPEWIEIFNTSDKPIELKGYKIAESSSSTKVIRKSLLMMPGQYLVVAKDSAIFNYYGKIPNAVIASFGNLNNRGDKIMLLDSLNRTIDSVGYISSWGGGGGKSLERIIAAGSSNDSKNWGTSQSRYNGTPGIINSLSPKNVDLAIKEFNAPAGYVEAGKPVNLEITIVNLGRNKSGLFMLKIYRDGNFNISGESSELITSIQNSGLDPGEEFHVSRIIDNCSKGINQFLAVIESAGDEFPDNNLAVFKINGVVINEEPGDLVVNEIMYAPGVNEPEWLEIYNRSAKNIDLNGYRIVAGSSDTKIFSRSFMLYPGEYLVAAKDSAIFARYGNISKTVIKKFGDLNNNGDKVLLLDSLARTIDSLLYSPKWGGLNGSSLERINPAISSNDALNWGTSKDPQKGTPGRINSLTKKDYDLLLNKITSVPVFPVLGGKVVLKAEISNDGNNGASFTVRLSEIGADGKKTQLEESKELTLPAGASMTYQFNYSVESLLTERTFEGLINYPPDQDNGNNSASIKLIPGYPPHSIAINEIMYSPLTGAPEWVELYNNSDLNINLSDWSVTDLLATPTKTKIIQRDYYFAPRSYLVLTKDSLTRPGHLPIPSGQIILNLPTLNNDKDGIVILDRNNETIDSVFYYNTWGGTDGHSLERISASGSSVDRDNWSSSTDNEYSTPGRINSVTRKQYDLIVKSLSTVPEFPGPAENVKLAAKIYNAGNLNADSYNVEFYRRLNDKTIFLDEAVLKNLAAKDSINVLTQKSFLISGGMTATCKIQFALDEDTINSSQTIVLTPGAKRGAVLITEIMYDPFAGESQWVEIYNTSGEPVNLKNWSLSDLLPAPAKGVIAITDSYINQGEYAVIARDTSHYQFYPPKKFYQAKFGSLNKTGDGVIVSDFRGAVIDSLKYNQSWGGSNGVSLERFSVERSSTDSTNWASSISTGGATPGIINSVANAKKFLPGGLLINEIMFDPATGNSNYIELYNPQSDSAQLGGLHLKLGSGTLFNVAETSFKIGPYDFYLIASDSLILKNYLWLKGNTRLYIPHGGFRLLNEGEPVVLKDLFGNRIDSVYYLPSWHNKNFVSVKNKSLERINPSFPSNDKNNWSTCAAIEGGTPGKINSLYTGSVAPVSGVKIAPNPFSPDNDGFEDFTIINLSLDRALSQIRIRIYDSMGRLMRTLVNNAPATSKNAILFDGRDENGKALRIGIYIVLIEAADTATGGVETFKVPLVVARKL